MEKMNIFFTPLITGAYAYGTAIKLTKFRQKSACSSNYRGTTFFASAKRPNSLINSKRRRGLYESFLISRFGLDADRFFCCFYIAGCVTAMRSGESR